MLHNLKSVTGCTLQAVDGDIGRCKDFLFVDEHWLIRWMVADTHKWLPLGRKVLVSPLSIKDPSWSEGVIPIALTRKTIETSPSINEHKPVSRSMEDKLFRHFSHSSYWAGAGISGTYPYANPLLDIQVEEANTAGEDNTDAHLRSFKEVCGYEVMSTTGYIGTIEDFIIQTDDWEIDFVIVNTKDRLADHRRVIIDTAFLGNANWQERTVTLDLSKQQIEASPLFVPEKLNDSGYQNAVYEYYRFQKNWNELRQRA